MSFLKSLKEFVSHVGSAVVSALGYASTRGLTDAVVEAAKAEVKAVASSTLDNSAKREMVVAKLSALTHLPESVVRLAVELAIHAMKADTQKI